MHRVSRSSGVMLWSVFEPREHAADLNVVPRLLPPGLLALVIEPIGNCINAHVFIYKFSNLIDDVCISGIGQRFRGKTGVPGRFEVRTALETMGTRPRCTQQSAPGLVGRQRGLGSLADESGLGVAIAAGQKPTLWLPGWLMP